MGKSGLVGGIYMWRESGKATAKKEEDTSEGCGPRGGFVFDVSGWNHNLVINSEN